MYGPTLLVEYLATPAEKADKYGNHWQYNSRSDRHSKIGCWGIALDLITTSALLREHATSGKVVLGVNHSMTDFATGRKKKLDLVFARPEGPVTGTRTFKGLASQYGVVLTDEVRDHLSALPDVPVANVGAVLIALEAKAAMTAHVKALPRLYDELNSSHLCVHGASGQALAIGYVQINAAKNFASSVTNNFTLGTRDLIVTKHNQPNDTLRVIEKVGEIPRRSATSEVGFDGLGITVLDFENQGGTVDILDTPPAPQPGDQFHYSSMIVRMANEYDTRFGKI